MRKNKTPQSLTRFVEIKDKENSIVIYETLVFDENQNCIDYYNEEKKLVGNENMGVYMFE